MTGKDIRMKTQLIVRKDGAYLSGLSLFIRWRESPYDAWMTRDREQAERVARRTGGIVMLFNPVVNQMRVL
jgi:hypothetical protein